MALLDFNFAPTNRQLRQFGCVAAVALPVAAWLWTRNVTATGWAGGIGAALCVLGLAVPKLLKPVFVGLTILTIPIGLVVGELSMLLIYFGLFLPMAIVFRIIGRDSLQRHSPADHQTYWQSRRKPSGSASYFRQF